MIVYEIKDENGVTDKQKNQQIPHQIPIGTLVEINLPECQEHGCRLFVCGHNRDCDGTPLYSLSFNPNAQTEIADLLKEMNSLSNMDNFSMENILMRMQLDMLKGSVTSGYPEYCLTLVTVSKSNL